MCPQKYSCSQSQDESPGLVNSKVNALNLKLNGSLTHYIGIKDPGHGESRISTDQQNT